MLRLQNFPPSPIEEIQTVIVFLPDGWNAVQVEIFFNEELPQN